MKVSTTNIENQIITELLYSNSFFHFSWSSDNDYNCSTSFLEKTKTTLTEISNLPFKHFSLIQKNSNIEEGFSGEELYILLKQNLGNEDNKKVEFTYRIKTNDDKPLWIKEIASVKTDDNNNKKIVSVAFEVTDFVQKEIELNKVVVEKIQLNKAKDKLISIISHDLRSPFTSLLGFTEILLSEPDLPVEERMEFLEHIHNASKFQLDMVNQLLDWTNLKNGTMRFVPQKLDIANIASNCISVLTGVSIHKNIEVKLNSEPNQFVIADERLITQVIANLLSNALKFTPDGEKITIDINNFNKDETEIIVKDSGVGIAEKDQEKLFNIETKFSKTGTAGEKGSGLGLTLVKEIVEKHSGKIWFHSKLNEGSEFHFTLPKAKDTTEILEDEF
ncbi:MAG: HAMP domain-containing sensor histidine kinase [Melioribacteraceae bacterium]